jgi:protein SERAC1
LLVTVSNRIDPLLRVIKLRRNPSISSTIPTLSGNFNEASLLLQPSTITQNVASIEDSPPPSCVTCVVLTEPPEDQPIRADVIFIHGLHGSLVNTWKQGLWNSAGKKVNIKRPPKPPVRPPKRPRRSRSTLIIPSKTKRPRFTDTFQDIEVNQDRSGSEEDEQFVNCSTFETESAKFTYECEAPSDTDFVDDVEYSFPTFRLRVEDKDSDSIEGSNLIGDQAKRKAKCKKDENWSACWPKDWLPLDCPGVRVIALNYTTDPYLWRPTWVQKQNRTSLADRAREMTEMLMEKKVGQGHPIIWVGHSKGGIFIKQILVDAWDSGRAATQSLWQNSRGTLFYSVPHRGSPLADFKLPLLHQSIELTEIQKSKLISTKS